MAEFAAFLMELRGEIHKSNQDLLPQPDPRFLAQVSKETPLPSRGAKCKYCGTREVYWVNEGG